MTRQDAIYELLNSFKYNVDESFMVACNMAIDALQTIDNCDQCEWCCPSDGIPTIHVVRCGECRHKYMKDFDMFCPYMVGIIKPNMYCSYGERKEP